MDERFSQPVHDILCAAGWFEGRKVSIDTIRLPEEFTLFPKAEEVLLEFGGLHLGESRRGVNCAAGDIEIMPLAGGRLGSHIKRYEPVIQTRLYPLGYLLGRHCILLIDELGRIYLINSSLIRRARSFDHSLELLLLGVRTDPTELAAGWGPHASPEIQIDA